MKQKIGRLRMFLVLTCCGSLFAESGFKPIFNGEDLSGWDGKPGCWRVEDGCLVGESTKEYSAGKSSTYIHWTGGAPVDFELKFEFKLRNLHSGVQFRSHMDDKLEWVMGGYQTKISEEAQWMGGVIGQRYLGPMAWQGEKVINEGKNKKRVAHVGAREDYAASIDTEGWNEMHIIAYGNQCISMINGRITSEFSVSENDLKEGLIGFQIHKGPPMKVSFRNIRLRQLAPGEKKQILILAKDPAAPFTHTAGAHLLARSLNESGLDVIAQVIPEGAWPESWQGYNNPDAVVIYSEGGDSNLAKEQLSKIEALVDAGAGLVCLDGGLAAEPASLGRQFQDWLGGYFDANGTAVAPSEVSMTHLPKHSITSGVNPFSIQDEWLRPIRFGADTKRITPILSNASQSLAWAYERTGGSRSFGFTGGAIHSNWQNDDFRKLVLNALVWVTKTDIPETGVASRTPTDLDMALNLSKIEQSDPKKKEKSKD